jgi:SAM-dependent methyltransferase
MRKLNCRLCGSAKLEHAVEMNPLPLVDSYSLEPNQEPLYPCGLDLCSQCGHIQLSEVVDPALMFRDGYLFRTGDYPWLVEHFRAYADSVYAEFKPKHVLEIGSNDGTLLKMFEGKGCSVLGVDPCDVPSSVPKIKAYFNSQWGEDRQYDLVLANHVFAHIDDLDEVMLGVKRALKRNGIFIFEADYGMDVLEKHYFDRVYHEHLDYHTVTPLCDFFARHDLVLFRVEHNDCKGGSIRGFVAHTGRAVERSVRLWKMYELRDMSAALELFASKLERRREAVHAELNGVAAVGYGASAGPIATMYHLGLEKMISWIVDDSPRRQGLKTPHSNIPVLDPATLHGAERVVLLAHRYAEQIKARHPHIDFIVP